MIPIFLCMHGSLHCVQCILPPGLQKEGQWLLFSADSVSMQGAQIENGQENRFTPRMQYEIEKDILRRYQECVKKSQIKKTKMVEERVSLPKEENISQGIRKKTQETKKDGDWFEKVLDSLGVYEFDPILEMPPDHPSVTPVKKTPADFLEVPESFFGKMEKQPCEKGKNCNRVFRGKNQGRLR